MDDANVVTSLKAGNKAALEEIYRSRFEALCIYVSAIIPPEDATDIVQDVFWAIWKGREQLPVDTEEALFHYMLRSVRNNALKVIRRDQVRSRHESYLEREAYTNGEENEELFDRQLLQRVQSLVSVLPARSREMLVLRWYHGLSLERIASLMGISYGYARVLHTRALDMLRQRLDLPGP